jgi:hypothetical protein
MAIFKRSLIILLIQFSLYAEKGLVSPDAWGIRETDRKIIKEYGGCDTDSYERYVASKKWINAQQEGCCCANTIEGIGESIIDYIGNDRVAKQVDNIDIGSNALLHIQSTLEKKESAFKALINIMARIDEDYSKGTLIERKKLLFFYRKRNSLLSKKFNKKIAKKDIKEGNFDEQKNPVYE